MTMDDHIPYFTPLNGRKTLIKPPLSKSLRSGCVILAPGEEVGEHITEKREEAIVILSGTATIICSGKAYEVKEKNFAYIPPETVHNVTNRGSTQLEYVYVVGPVDSASIGTNDAHSHSHTRGPAHTHN